MKIIALDMASKTGWSVWEDGRLIESGVQDFTKQRGESNGILFLKFRKWIIELCRVVRPQVICYEGAHFRGGASTEICVGLQTRAQEAAAEMDCECCKVATMTLKKFATGRGNADKAEMVVVAAKIIGRPPIDDNEADAVLIGKWASNQFEV